MTPQNRGTVTVGPLQPASAPYQCPFCEGKTGLPILPLRYAVARGDMGDAPKLNRPFDATASEGTYGGESASLALDATYAQYTTRLLRPGYLYVYDEHAGQWYAYIVTKDGFLYEIEAGEAPPPGGWSNATFACSRQSEPGHANDDLKARCFTIENPEEATYIWMAFSDTAWTLRTYKQHDDAAYRKAHMRCLNVADWLGKKATPHVAAMSELSQRVVEYAAKPDKLAQETKTYVKQLLPKACPTPLKATQMLHDPNTHKETEWLLPPLVRDLIGTAAFPEAYVSQYNRRCAVSLAAWAFSVHPLYLPAEDEASRLEGWGKQVAAPHEAAMVALDDPPGIAMDLNGLVLQRVAEITAKPEYRWKYQTAGSIAALRQIVCQSEVTKESRSRQQKIREMLDGPGPDGTGGGGLAMAALLAPKMRKEQQDLIEAAGKLSPQDIKQVIHDGWESDYATRFNEPELDDYLKTVQTKLAAAAKPLVAGLDNTYVAWLESQTLKRHFTHNFDDSSLDSGVGYAAVARLILNQASGRTKPARFLTASLGKDPTSPDNWPARALLFNHAKLVAHLKDSAADTNVSWNNLADKIVGYLLMVVAAGNAGKLDRAGGALAKLVHQMAGPLVNIINGVVDTAMGKAGKLLSARMQVGMLGALAKLDDPDNLIVDLRGVWTRKQAVRALAKALAAHAGGDPLLYRPGVRKAFDEASKMGGTKTPFKGLLVVKKSEIEGIDSLSKAERKQVISGALSEVRPEQFDDLLERGAGKIANLDVKAGIVGAIFAAASVGISYRDLLAAKPGQFDKELWNMGSGVSSLLGGVMDAAGKGLKNLAGDAPRLAAEVGGYTLKTAQVAEWLDLGGKVFGVIGGLISAGLLGVQAYEERRAGETGLAAVHGLLAVFSAAGALALLLVPLVGAVILIVVALIEAVMAWLRDDAIQNWLNKSHFFGRHQPVGVLGDLGLESNDDYEPYTNPLKQHQAFKALLATGA